MAKKLLSPKQATKQTTALIPPKTVYISVLTNLTQLIADSRYRALATVNRELLFLYWQIGRVIVQQQEIANWGDSIVERLSKDLRLAFPDMKGLSLPNVWKMRQFFLVVRSLDAWLADTKLSTVARVLKADESPSPFLSTLSREIQHPELPRLMMSLSWSHHTGIFTATDSPAEHYFYMTMAVRERWSVRELRRQIDAALFERYTSVKRDPEQCLPTDAEYGDLMLFKDHYILEFLGLENEHSEKELRKAILANLRDFFLEFGKDLTFVGEEYPLTVGNDTFYIDLLFFHRRLQCLIAVDLKKGKFKPEHAGKSRFYCAALDEQLRLAHENPSLGLVLCRTADATQVRLALTAAAERIGIATYQTALPDERLIKRRLEQLPQQSENDE